MRIASATMGCLIPLLLSILASCTERDTVQALSVCDALEEQASSRVVRVAAHLIVTDHGNILIDANCIERGLVWEETQEFRRSSAFQDFGRQARDVNFSEWGTQYLAVDAEGVLSREGNAEALVFKVQRLRSYRRVPTLPETDEGPH